MKKKWIYIEPFVFIWQDSTHYLFYNSLNGKKTIISQNDTIIPIVQSILVEENAYCVQIKDEIINKKDFVDFIKVLSSNQLGNVVTCSESERPVNIPPKLIVGTSVGSNKIEYFDPWILTNINELIIQVSGECNFNCKNCGEYNLQLVHCSRSNYSISIQKIENLVHQVKHLKLQKLNITGGDILTLEKFEFIINAFSTVNILKIYNVHFKQINSEKIQYILDKDKSSLIRLIVHYDDISDTELLNKINDLVNCDSRILWSFVVSSEKELEFFYSILDKCKSIQNEIKPFYNKENKEFIKEFVFIDNEDIEEINPDKRQIFVNQVINRNYFGKVTILADGQVFDNINFDSVGNIDDYLEDIIHKIITEGRSWRWVRSNDICDDCLYKLICPPPSNLELVMNSKTICQSPKAIKQCNAC